MTVAVFKLKNGDEVIGTFDDVDTGWKVYKPQTMVQVMTPEGPQWTLRPWGMFIRIDDVVLTVDDVFVMGAPPAQIEQMYLQKTTGIAVPAKSGIIV